MSKICSFTLHISRVVLDLLRQRRGRGNELGTPTNSCKNYERCRGHPPRNHDQVPARRREHWPGSTTNYLRRPTSAAANNRLGTTIKYLLNQTAGAGNNWAMAHIQKSWAQIQMNTASKLGSHTQTGRGACPGVGH
jgi:hypothetical protein